MTYSEAQSHSLLAGSAASPNSEVASRDAHSVRRVAILGATGSIGMQTADVILQHPDKLSAVALAAHRSVEPLVALARKLDVAHLAFGDASLAQQPQAKVALDWAAESAQRTVAFGPQAVADLARMEDADVVVNALVGEAGMRASCAALEAGHVLALANKESLVVAGDLIMPLAARVDDMRRHAGLAPANGPAGALMPIDSEHGAIYQCLLGENAREVSKLWVTASGGPFRGMDRSQLATVTPARALAHPTWTMGPKITIDSSTLMNKGLEVIEAHHLFAMPYDKIEVVVQPQSAIHSMVEFADGSVKAHLGTTDMRIPIQFALSYPDRWDAPVKPLDFRTLGTLEFDAPDEDTFRCLALAREAGRTGGTLPCAMNAANEVAVAAFLQERIAYLDIARLVEEVMDAHQRQGVQAVEGLDQLEAVDLWARACAEKRAAELR